MQEIKDPKMWFVFDKYCAWLSLPHYYSKLTVEQLEEKGFPGEVIELLLIKTKTDFSKKFDVEYRMLTEWDNHPELHNKVKKNWKSWAKCLTPGIMGKFAEKLMEDADPARVKIWLQSIEDEGKEDNQVNVNLGFANILHSMKEDGELGDKPKEEIK